VQDLPNSEDNYSDIADLGLEKVLSELLDQVCNQEHSECTNDAEAKVAETKKPLLAPWQPFPWSGSSRPEKTESDLEEPQGANTDSNPTRTEVTKSSRPTQPRAEIMSAHLMPSQEQDGQKGPRPLPVIIANNLPQEQEDKLLEVLRQHKKAIGWKLSDLPGINPSICMHRILVEEEIKLIRQQQRRMNLTLLDVVKKEVTKLLTAGIIYPISDSQWVSLVQVVPKKSEMTVTKNQHDELVPMRIQNS
ncbi:hypothetical protein CR513_05958, partial [Mucuna pruriens]